MSALDLLGVAIGIVFVYLLLSLICSALYELVEARVKRRASNLVRGIQDLLQGDSTQPDKSERWVEQFYSHPLIFSLYNGHYQSGNHRNLPSYIPARSFALALIDLVQTNHRASRPETFSVQSFRSSVLALQESHLRTVLLALIDGSGGNSEKLYKNIEEWYDGTMDRASGWYKRQAQVVLFGMGLVLALLLNADTFAIATTLVRNENAREALIAASEAYAQEAQSDRDTSGDPSSPIESCQRDVNSPECRVDRNLAQLRALPLPLGWGATDLLRLPAPAEWAAWLWAWLAKLVGCLCTALAISLGAPFWFDALNKLMVIRSTVKPKEKSPEEASEDRQHAPQRVTVTFESSANNQLQGSTQDHGSQA